MNQKNCLTGFLISVGHSLGINRGESQDVNGLITYLGHAVGYMHDGQGVITKARQYFGNTREPFAITLGGEKLYFLTSPEDVALAYKNTTSLTFDNIVHELSIAFGVSRQSVERAYRRPTSELDDVITQNLQIKNPQLKSVAHFHNDLWKQQLLPGDLYREVQQQFADLIESSLRLNRMTSHYVISPHRNEGKIVSLLKWTQEVLVDAALRIFFGDKLLELDPNLPRHFLAFDEDSWKLVYKWPNATKMHTAKAKVTHALVRYLALPQEERKGAAYLVEMMERTQRALDFSEEDIANVFCIVLWTTNTNTYKVCFWLLAHLLHNPPLLSQIREETAPAFHQADTPLSPQYLLDSCPYLSAAFDETLRLCSDSSSVRCVTAPTTISGKEFPTGSRVVFPSRQLHLDSSVFGTDVNEWIPQRFLCNKKLGHSSSYRPFGGGLSYCPGRLIARQEVVVFVAVMLKRFDVEIVGDGRLPRLDSRKPSTGMMSPQPGEDVLVRLTPRQI